MIELWGRKNAYNVQKVLWTLAELGLEFVHHDVGSSHGDLQSPDYLSLNPHARIPTLVDDGEVVWESNSIVRYLACRYARGNLWPEQPLQRSLAERWMDWELATLQPDFIDLFWGYYRTPEAQRNSLAIEQSQRCCANHFIILDDHLKRNDFLAGDHFTMGDIAVATCLYRYFTMGLPVATPQRVMSWYGRLGDRIAFRETIMVAYEELSGRVDF